MNVTGTMSEQDAARLREHLDYTYEPGDAGMEHFGPLSFSTHHPSLCGIGCWPAPGVSAAGNLAERGYEPEDVRAELEKLLGIAPSMMLVVHCGGDYESGECVATIRTGEGLAVLLPPEVTSVAGPSEGQMARNLMANLLGG